MNSENGSLNLDLSEDELREELSRLYGEMEECASSISESGTKCKIPSGRGIRRVIRNSKSNDPEALITTINTVVDLTQQLNEIGKQ